MTYPLDGVRAIDDSTLVQTASSSQAQQQTFNQFLQSVSASALQMARLSCGNLDDAAELVQEAMLRHARHYAARPKTEWRPLFYRTLQNVLRDHARRQSLRRYTLLLFGDSHPQHDTPEPEIGDPAATAQPDAIIERGQQAEALDQALQALSLKQRQAFLLRIWEGLDVADTAKAMQCSEGSVKTHLSRAMERLRQHLGDSDAQQKFI